MAQQGGATQAQRTPAEAARAAGQNQTHPNIVSDSAVRVHAHTRTGIGGGFLKLHTMELCALWSCLQGRRIRALDVRTYLSALEVRHRRNFLSEGRRGRYALREIEGLVGKVGELKLRASIARLERAGLMTWTGDGPQFYGPLDGLCQESAARARAMFALMPKGRRFMPLPRRCLRLMAGGVKRSVLASMFGHLLRCVHHSKAEGWNGVGACKASWLSETFGISLSSARAARSHLIEELGWLSPVEAPQWYMNRYGGKFKVNLRWNLDTPASVGEGQSGELSTAKSGPPSAKSGGPESKQTFPTETIQPSDPGAPRPRVDSSKGILEGGKPRLQKIQREDLRKVERVMVLFDQATVDPAWKRKGWSPADSYLERLNWAAAARRAHVRGGTNPCGLFVHLVSQRKWEHICNEDEQAVRRELALWMNPEPSASAETKGGRLGHKRLSPDGAIIRHVEAQLHSKQVLCSQAHVDQQLERSGWSTERVAQAREDLEVWSKGGSSVA